MKVLGDTTKFALLFGESKEQFRTVEIWVRGNNVTSIDSSAYVPGLSAALARSERSLREELNFLRHEALFFGLSAEETFLKLAEPSAPELEQSLVEPPVR